jgi:DNA-binding transcriptional regulator YiaG
MNKIKYFKFEEKVGINETEFDSMLGNELRRINNYDLVDTIFDHPMHAVDEEEIQEFFKSKAKLFEPDLNCNKKQTKKEENIKLKYSFMKDIDIIKIRRDLGKTQQEFAEFIGVDRRTIINYEQGKKIPASRVKLLNQLLEDNKTKNAKPEEFNKLKEKFIEPSLFQNENINKDNEYELKYISQLEAEIAELKRELFFINQELGKKFKKI